MKRIIFFGLAVTTLVILTQCATMQTWPTYERTAEDRMTVIQQKIGEGLKTGALTPDDGQILLAKLEDIRKDYLTMVGKRVYRRDWENLLGRLDVLEDEVNRKISLPPRIEGTAIEDRLITLQRRIDDRRIAGRLTQTEAREFQARLDAIRSDYLRMTEGGRFVRYEDRAEIYHRLDLLETDLDRYR